jgi:hypothetical protein
METGDLLGGDPMLSANGRADIDSKRAPDQRCHAQFCQPFQFEVDKLGAHLGLLHLQVSPEDLAVMSRHPHWHDDAAKPAAREEVYEAHK